MLRIRLPVFKWPLINLKNLEKVFTRARRPFSTAKFILWSRSSFRARNWFTVFVRIYSELRQTQNLSTFREFWRQIIHARFWKISIEIECEKLSWILERKKTRKFTIPLLCFLQFAIWSEQMRKSIPSCSSVLVRFFIFNPSDLNESVFHLEHAIFVTLISRKL